MKLWLDDERNPDEWRPNQDFVWVKTAKEAINLIKAGGVTEVSLDHDLGTEETGYTVAQFIEEGAYFGTIKRMKWNVHSANPAGSINIQFAMKSADKFWDADGNSYIIKKY